MKRSGDQRGAFFGDDDARLARGYIEDNFGAGAYLAIGLETPDRDEVLIAGFLSARDYMRQSEGCNGAGLPLRLFAGLIETIRPNAFATHHRGLHLCGFNTGLYGAIFELCHFVMAQPGVLKDVGDPAHETGASLPPGIVPGFWMIDQLRSHGSLRDKTLAPSFMPRCPERASFAIILTLHMMRFVWFHELYHCLNGHVGALSRHVPSIRLNEMPDDAGLAALVELEKARLPMGKPAFMQAIELDADRTALWAAFRTQIEDKENIIALQSLDGRRRISLCLLSAYLITNIFDEAGRRWGQSASTHPGSYTRLHNLIRTTASHLLDADPGVHATFQEVMRELRALKRSIPALVDADRVLADCLSPSFQALLDAADEQLEAARAYFEAFAFR